MPSLNFFSSKKIKMDLALSVYPSILEKNMKMQNKSTEKRFVFVVAVHLLSRVQLFSTPWTAAHQAFLSFTISRSLHKFMSIQSVMPSNHLILCCPFSSHLQSFPASGAFQMSHFFAGGQSTGVSASASVFPMNIQD